MLSSKKGAANVALIAVIVVAVVLAAALVTTYVTLSKANEATEQKLADLSAKVDAQKYVTAAEVEAMIADIDLPEGVSKEYVAREITAAINSYKTRDITPYVIQLMIDKSIKAIPAGLTEADVQALIAAALAE